MAIAPLSFKQRLLYAACLGVAIGGIATLYYVALKFILWAVWTWLPNTLRPGSAADFRSFAWFLTALGGLLVGVVVFRLGAPTGLNEAIDEIHREGRIGYRQMPGMVIASLVSLGFGSSAGPEAPLVDINGGVASWVADRLKLSQVDSRTLTFCGISAALGAFFGSPLGSALLALELPHSFGLEYYEAIIPVIVAAIAGFVVFRCLTGLTIGGLYQFPDYGELQPHHLLYAVLLGLVGAAIAVLFILIFRATQRLVQPLRHRPILLNTLGGLVVGAIAFFLPLTLFYGEREIQTIIDTGPQIGVGLLLLTAIAKMFTLSLSIQSGFRGGVIFPIFLIGAAVGMAMSLLIPDLPPSVAMVCTMAAMTVGVIKTPVSMALILTVISDEDLIPMITVASIISFILTLPINLFSMQRSRS
jgi:H+/Cl- antiporter ClcA